MTAVKHVDAQFFRQRISPVRAFTGDEGVGALGHRLSYLRAGTAGHDANPAALGRARGDHPYRATSERPT